MRDQSAIGIIARKLIDRAEAPPVTDAVGFGPVKAASAIPVGPAPDSASAISEVEVVLRST